MFYLYLEPKMQILSTALCVLYPGSPAIYHLDIDFSFFYPLFKPYVDPLPLHTLKICSSLEILWYMPKLTPLRFSRIDSLRYFK